MLTDIQRTILNILSMSILPDVQYTLLNGYIPSCINLEQSSIYFLNLNQDLVETSRRSVTLYASDIEPKKDIHTKCIVVNMKFTEIKASIKDIKAIEQLAQAIAAQGVMLRA